MGYTYVILKDGTIQWAADHKVRTPHVGDHNSRALGICLVGDFRHEQPTPEQYASLYELLEYLMEKLPGIKDVTQILGHQEYSGYAWKQCPALDMDALRGELQAKTYGAVKHNFNNDTKIEIVLPSGSKPRKTIQEPVQTIRQPTKPVKRTLLKRGYRGEDVKELQLKLNRLGHSLAVDGIFGAKTEAAVKDFQRKAKIEVDGIVGKQTLTALEKVLSAGPTVLRPGSPQRAAVKELQYMLKNAGFDPGTIDGIYGPRTRDAVLRFQKHYGVKPYDGIYGPKTAAKLKEVLR